MAYSTRAFTAAEDAAIKAGRLAGLSWKRIALPLHRKAGEIEGRHKALTDPNAARPKVAAKRGPDVNEDGLARLVRKRKLTAGRLDAAQAYRRLVREAQLADGALKSSLSDDVGGGGGASTRSPGVGPALTATAAKRELFAIRHALLKGQTDMLTVLDGVCGAGHTLADLAGSPARAQVLEAVLMCALDLLHAHLFPAVEKAA